MSAKADHSERVMSMVHSAQPAPADAPRDAAPAQPVMFQVDVYRVSVPFGTFSRNEQFWKRMDEQCVDAATGDLLNKNGIRVGRAPFSELDFFKKFMDEKPTMSRMSTAGVEAQGLELDMKLDLPEQTIFYYDANNQLTGRDYDSCSNVINMSFQPAPRKPGELRLRLCPMVRAKRKHFQYTSMNNEVEIDYVSPEVLYDLKLWVDIPRDRFFIVMPSPDNSLTNCVGRAFLTRDDRTERFEQILLVIPRAMSAVVPGK